MRKRLLAGIAVIVALPALAAGWSCYLGAATWHHLTEVRSALTKARAGITAAGPDTLEKSLAEFSAALATARGHASAARRFTGGLDWDLLTKLPLAGDGALIARGMARAADELTKALTETRQVASALASTATTARGIQSMGTLLAKFAELDVAATVQRARARLAWARHELVRTPPRTGIDAVDAARASAIGELDRLRGWLDKAATLAALPALFGKDKPSHYFLAFQTNAEARGTGGLVGAFGILTAGGGQFSIEKLAANTALADADKPVTDHGKAFLARYGSGALELLSISNLSPHFPYAAATWTALWERQTGQRLDGAIATDPFGLARLLSLTGPVTLPGGERVTAENVVDLTMRTSYERYSDPQERKRFLVTIAQAVVDALHGVPGARALPAFFELVEEGRLRIWSRHEAEEARLAATALGGVLPTRPGPYAHLVINNSGGTKLDYYLDRELTYDLGRRVGDSRLSRIRIKLTNNVPDRALPNYVTYRMDRPQDQPKVGANLLWVSLYAPVGATLTAADIDGKRTKMIAEEERSHPVYSTLLEMAPRQTRTIDLYLREPHRYSHPKVPVQPLVRPQRTTVTCGGRSCP